VGLAALSLPISDFRLLPTSYFLLPSASFILHNSEFIIPFAPAAPFIDAPPASIEEGLGQVNAKGGRAVRRGKLLQPRHWCAKEAWCAETKMGGRVRTARGEAADGFSHLISYLDLMRLAYSGSIEEMYASIPRNQLRSSGPSVVLRALCANTRILRFSSRPTDT
jgi:hypothetical protein